MKEIIIYNIYENDDNVPESNIHPIIPNEGEELNVSVGVAENDSDNYLEEFNVAEQGEFI